MALRSTYVVEFLKVATLLLLGVLLFFLGSSAHSFAFCSAPPNDLYRHSQFFPLGAR